ncbi:unnamed protein product [Heligmosomoides polygyrus]|uniref:CPSF_A domain-containing protein n=1 Tax=Heligmosomoides polygyrus TaxID=6339 RepID=A0A183FGC9_HELPZ|nr:unnamed protein product [Heligmosomoides polygyrus]
MAVACPVEYDFFQNLEMHVRANFPPLCGRDHLAFRSYYHPCKNVIDGDLCEQFGLMDTTAQRERVQVSLQYHVDEKRVAHTNDADTFPYLEETGGHPYEICVLVSSWGCPFTSLLQNPSSRTR